MATRAPERLRAPADDGRCRCDAPSVDPDDPDGMCWRCGRFLHDPEEDPAREDPE